MNSAIAPADEMSLYGPFHGRRLMVVAPHPDDETLGCGGLIAAHAARGSAIGVLFVTDGGASHRRSRAWPRRRLAELRRGEAEAALVRLGAHACQRRFLGLPDAAMPAFRTPAWIDARTAIEVFVADFAPDLVCLPWRRDPHRDHRDSHTLVTAALRQAARRTRRLEYAIWLDELGEAGDRPAAREARAADLDIGAQLATKRHAVAAHASQLGGVVTDDPTGFVLRPATLTRLVTATERYFVPCG